MVNVTIEHRHVLIADRLWIDHLCVRFCVCVCKCFHPAFIPLENNTSLSERGVHVCCCGVVCGVCVCVCVCVCVSVCVCVCASDQREEGRVSVFLRRMCVCVCVTLSCGRKCLVC